MTNKLVNVDLTVSGTVNATAVHATNSLTVSGIPVRLHDGAEIGNVRMIRSTIAPDSSWVVYKENGSVLDTSGSTTDGLQEAYNYANSNGFTLNVVGGGVFTGANDYSVIACSTPLVFGPGQIKTFIIRDCTINFAGAYSGSGAAVTIDTQVMCSFFWYAQLVCNHPGAALQFRPSTLGIGDALHSIGVFKSFIRTIQQASNASGASCVRFFCDTGEEIARSTFTFAELNGGDKGVEMVTSGTGQIIGNHFEFQGSHSFSNGSSGRALDMGSGGAAGLTGNSIALNSVSPTSAGVVLDVYGKNNDIWYNDDGTGTVGVKFNTGAELNRVYATKIGASTPVVDASSTGDNRLIYAGRDMDAAVIGDSSGDTTVIGATGAKLAFEARKTSIRRVAEVYTKNTATNGTGAKLVLATRDTDTLADRMEIDSSGARFFTAISGTNATLTGNVTVSGIPVAILTDPFALPGDILLNHTKALIGKNSAGSPGNLIKRSANDQTIIGDSTFTNAIRVQGAGLIALEPGAAYGVGVGTTSPTQKLHVVGSGIFTGDVLAERGTFTSGLTVSGLAVKLDDSVKIGYVRMVRTANSTNDTLTSAAWKVYSPDGDEISTAGTTTDGLQEAINYAARYGYDLRVFGGGLKPNYWAGNTYGGALGNNPFATVSSSPIVTVTHTAHGRSTGDKMTFNGMTATVNNIPASNFSSELPITYINANSYSVTVATNANATSSAGGASCRWQDSGQDVAIINCSTGIVVPPIQGVNWEIHATINFGGTGTTGIAFDSIMSSRIVVSDQIVCAGTYLSGVDFYPNKELPQDPNGPVITSSHIYLPSTVMSHASAACVKLDTTSGTISDCVFEVIEPNGGADGVRTVLSSSFGFTGNKIKVNGAHGQTGKMVAIGTSATGATSCHSNQWDIQGHPATGGVGVDVWGTGDIINLNCDSDQGVPAVGLKLESSATNNTVIYSNLTGTIPIQDLSGASTNTLVGSGIITGGIASRQGSFSTGLTVSGTPVAILTDPFALPGDIRLKWGKKLYLDNSVGSPSHAISRGAGDELLIGDSAYGNAFRIRNGGGLYLEPGANSSVSIGTDSPTQKLHVVGSGIFTGDVIANGFVASALANTISHTALSSAHTIACGNTADYYDIVTGLNSLSFPGTADGTKQYLVSVYLYTENAPTLSFAAIDSVHLLLGSPPALTANTAWAGGTSSPFIGAVPCFDLGTTEEFPVVIPQFKITPSTGQTLSVGYIANRTGFKAGTGVNRVCKATYSYVTIQRIS